MFLMQLLQIKGYIYRKFNETLTFMQKHVVLTRGTLMVLWDASKFLDTTIASSGRKISSKSYGGVAH